MSFRAQKDIGTLLWEPELYGRSHLGLPLEVWRPSGPCKLLVHAGIHGEEGETTVALSRALRLLVEPSPHCAVVLGANPDGLIRGTRGNARGVDLNRNFPTANWKPDPVMHRSTLDAPREVVLSPGSHPASEPETQALIRLIGELEPESVVALHAPLECIDDAKQGPLAEWLAQKTRMPLVEDVGYPTPGSFGPWGAEKGIGVVTYEFPLTSNDVIVRDHVPVLAELLAGGDSVVLNYIWIAFFLISFVVGLIRLVFFQDTEVFTTMVNSTFEMAQVSVDICLGLIGVLTLWLGLMKVGERGGAIRVLARLVRPFFVKLFPEVPEDHPVHGSMIMNFAANMLGLDNAATPLGLKAIQELQDLNPDPDTASNAQIMFLVLNTSGLTVLPISIMVYRAQLGAANPADVFLPILLTTFFSTMAGLIAVALVQRINLLDRTVLAYLVGLTGFVGAVIFFFSRLPQDQVEAVSNVVANVTLFSVMAGFISLAVLRKVNVYEAFIDGAKEGFSVVIKIIPYLVAILVSIGVFRASGSMDYLVAGIGRGFTFFGFNTDFIEALPTALMKPLSGSGARGMMVDAMQTYGADSFTGRLASTFQGATDTTFYIIALYFGSVGVKKTRYAVQCGLFADFVSVVAGILVAYLFFHG